MNSVDASPVSEETVADATELPWINPVGGLGDALMLSGVLEQVVRADPRRRFNLITRTKYPQLLRGHPALASIGHPPRGVQLLRTDYWAHPTFGPPEVRAYQVLARMYGLEPPVPETLFVPWPIEGEVPALADHVPWSTRNVLIGPTSESPRKQLDFQTWEELAFRLQDAGIGVMQAGGPRDLHVRGSYSLLGLTTPRQIIQLLPRFDLVVTCDNFLMHAAHLVGRPAVVVWGPTDHRTYGYAEHVHLQSPPCADLCIAPGTQEAYGSECPRGKQHCIDGLQLDTIVDAVMSALDPG